MKEVIGILGGLTKTIAGLVFLILMGIIIYDRSQGIEVTNHFYFITVIMAIITFGKD